MKRCDQCRYFNPYATRPDDPPGAIVRTGGHVYGGGECRRHAPVQPADGLLAWFPLVSISTWCGEFAPIDSQGEQHQDIDNRRHGKGNS
jgi:hypothetical protein